MNKSFRVSITALFFPFFLHGQFDVSVGTGSMWLGGEVDILCGLGSVNSIDVAIDYQLKNNFFFGGSIGYGNAKGLEQFNSWQHSSNGGGLVESFYDDYIGAIYAPYHSTNILSSNLEISFKMYLIHDDIFLKIGFLAGFSKASTYMNLFNSENKIYELPPSIFRALEPIYPPSLFDNTFESQMDLAGIFFQYGPSVGIGINVSKDGYLGIEYTMQMTTTDYLDGIAWKTEFDQTGNNDIIRRATIVYTHRFGTFNW